MDITKFFDRKKENLAVSQQRMMILKDYVKKAVTAPVSQHLLVMHLNRVKSGDCVKILVNCMQNIQKHVK